MTEKTSTQTSDIQAEANPNVEENISGRGVFVIETVAAGVAVRSAFLAEDGRLLDIPAVFPDLMYAMAQIDELKQHVARRFAEAAQIGSQFIAQQIEMNRAQSQAQGTVTASQADQSEPQQVETRHLQQDSAPQTSGQSPKFESKDIIKASKAAVA